METQFSKIIENRHPMSIKHLPSRELTYHPKNGIFEDDFPFPQVGYVNFLEGIRLFVNRGSDTKILTTTVATRCQEAKTQTDSVASPVSKHLIVSNAQFQ